MRFAFLVLILCSVLTYTWASCYMAEPCIGNAKPKKIDCAICVCVRGFYQCCMSIARPVGYDRKKCRPVFDKDGCKFNLVRRDSSPKTCSFTGYRGARGSSS